MARNYGKKKWNKKARKPRARKQPTLAVGHPSRIVRKLRFTQYLSLNPGSGSTAANVFRINSCYDPDATGVGAQPRCFDQYCGADTGAGLYKKFVVLGARAKVHFVNSSLTDPQIVGLAIRNSSTVMTDVNDYQEQGYRRWATMGIEGGSKAQKILNLNFSAKKWFGKSSVTTEKDLEGSFNLNPTAQAFLHVFASGMNGLDTAAVECYVTIDYIVMFREPSVPGSS